MENMQIYNAVREVPRTAQKEIKGGRLNGKTDINPMWRIKMLTEQFGPCGYGWRYEITDKHIERTVALGNELCEAAAFVDINLYVKWGDEWSEAIPGTGGSTFIAKEKSGMYMSDECYKMALTDALSVACKALGVGADVYWDKDVNKYAKKDEKPKPTDVFDMPGADKADNKTLFVNALRIAGMTNEQGAEILKDIFGAGTKINDLDEADFCNLIAALGE